jgi:hypothetical protein
MGLDLFISKEKISYPPRRVYDNAHELKVIIFNKHDCFAEEQAQKSK